MKKFLLSIILISVIFSGAIAPLIGNIAFAAETDKAKQGTEWSCSVMSTGGVLGCVVTIVAQLLGWIIYPTTTGLTNVGGYFIDKSIEFTINTSWLKTGPGPDSNVSIEEGWGIVRDICNMAFIFMLVYMGISTIIGVGGYNLKTKLVSLIIAALLVNFSLFITQMIIDAGNLFASLFFEAIKKIGTSMNTPSVGGIIQQATLTQAMMTGFKVQGDISEIVVPIVFRIAINVIAFYVYIKVALLFLGRTVAFIFLMVTAPIGFVGHLLPKLDEYYSKWWKTLTDQVMVAPVFLLLFYVIARFVTSEIFLNTFSNVTAANGDSFNLPSYFGFALVIGLLIGALKITEELSGEIGSAVSGAVVTGATAAIGGVGMIGGALMKSGIARGGRFGAVQETAGTILKSASSVTRGMVNTATSEKPIADLNKQLSPVFKKFGEAGFSGVLNEAMMQQNKERSKLIGEETENARVAANLKGPTDREKAELYNAQAVKEEIDLKAGEAAIKSAEEKFGEQLESLTKEMAATQQEYEKVAEEQGIPKAVAEHSENEKKAKDAKGEYDDAVKAGISGPQLVALKEKSDRLSRIATASKADLESKQSVVSAQKAIFEQTKSIVEELQKQKQAHYESELKTNKDTFAAKVSGDSNISYSDIEAQEAAAKQKMDAAKDRIRNYARKLRASGNVIAAEAVDKDLQKGGYKKEDTTENIIKAWVKENKKKASDLGLDEGKSEDKGGKK